MDAHEAVAAEGGLVATSDVARLWQVTPARVQALVKADPLFPPPLGAVSGGTMKVWTLAAIRDYREPA